tara:strand:- start:37138 stop:39807 length:2670 start_codon:yes stop_codon:yes gene_type:complete
MPRSVYYQSPGNPIQIAKVPPESLELEFVYHRGVDNDDEAYSKSVLNDVVFVSFAGLFVLWMQAILLNVSIISLILFSFLVLLLWRIVESRLNTMSSTVVLAILAVWLYSLVPLPGSLDVLVAIMATLCLAREVVRHFTFLATVAPVQLRTAWTIRKAVCWQTLASSMVLLPIAIGVSIPSAMPTTLLIGGFAAAVAVLMYVENPRDYADNFWDAVRSWCSYNRNESHVAGILLSPAGTCKQRIRMLVVVALLNACVIFKVLFLPLLSGSGLRSSLAGGSDNIVALVAQLCIAGVASGIVALLPLSMILAVLCVVGIPVFGRMSLPEPSYVPADEWKEITDRIRQSRNDVERNSIYLGRVSYDQSPMLVPTDIFKEHAHFLGDSGSGKTARGLAPFIEQVLGTGKASAMILDLKGDSQELLQTVRCGVKTAKELDDVEVPIRYFSLRDDQATYGFNPFRLSSWQLLNDLQKTDILCGAMGLIYGSDYGEGYYSSANASVLYATVRHFPNVASFEELAEKIGYVLARPKAHGLDAKSRDAGNHVKMTVTRLASIAALNVGEDSTPNEDVLEHCIDPGRLFAAPEAHYYSMSATLGPGSSPEVARFATFMLMMASTLSKRDVPVYLIIDEFQRMASKNLDYLLQLARSMGVAVILANQSMQDLQRYDLVSVLETNCRYRQWFAISGWDDQERLSRHSGETVDLLNGESISSSTNDKGTTTSSSHSVNEFVGPRLTQNDIKLVSDDDRKSIVLINRGSGYAQYGGMPVVIESDFHISQEEYRSRKQTPWPTDDIGTFIPANWDRPASRGTRRGRDQPPAPTITHESIPTSSSNERREAKRRRRGAKKSNAPVENTGGTETESETSDAFDRYLRENPLQSEDKTADDTVEEQS